MMVDSLCATMNVVIPSVCSLIVRSMAFSVMESRLLVA
jgi:hypothetical protein